MGELAQKALKGTIWAALEKLGMRAMSFVVTLVLARLLTPADYGTVALLAIFISIASVLADSGFGQALVQKKDATELDFNSVFYLSVFWSGCIYLVLFLGAPRIAAFYETPDLVPIIRVLASTIILHGINSVQSAELNRKLLFNLSFRVSLVVSLVQGVVGIALAFYGYGPWSLVWGQVAASVAQTIGMWCVIAWRPRLQYSWRSVKELFRYGWKLTASELINTGYNNLYGLFIGKIYTKEDLAFVQRGNSVPYLGMETINGTLGRVAFPVLAQLQNDPERLREGMRHIIQCSTLFVFPLMMGCAVCAPSLVYVMFGEQWRPAVPFVQLACFSYALWPLHTVNLYAISARGRSDVYLYLEIAKKIMGVLVLLLTYRYGVLVMIVTSTFLSGPLGLLLNIWPNHKMLGYRITMQIKDVAATLACTMLMGAVVCGMGWMLSGLHPYALLPIQVLVGIVVFSLLVWYTRFRASRNVVQLLAPRLAGRCPLFARYMLKHFGEEQ